jgi:phytoene synthase
MRTRVDEHVRHAGLPGGGSEQCGLDSVKPARQDRRNVTPYENPPHEPGSVTRRPEHDADLAACRALLRTGSRSFHAASMLLPRRVRDPATALFAFCRAADDAIDLQGGPVSQLRARLALIYDGRPAALVADRALARVIERHALPRALPDALLEGFAWDAEGRRYRSMADLHAYAARVAGSVGAMMAVLMGARDAEALARACDLGVAMQLSNIARDVGEDARAGRLYLPLDWLSDAGIDADAWLARPVFTPALGRVIARVLEEAERLYVRADSGIAMLPLDCRPGIKAARLFYAGIGHAVARRGMDSVTARAVVSRRRKAALLARGAAGFAWPAPRNREDPLPAVRHLVDAAAVAVRASAPRESRAAWLLDLLIRLEQRDELGLTP